MSINRNRAPIPGSVPERPRDDRGTPSRVVVVAFFGIWLVFDLLAGGHSDESPLEGDFSFRLQDLPYYLHVLVQVAVHACTAVVAWRLARTSDSDTAFTSYYPMTVASLFLLYIDLHFEWYNLTNASPLGMELPDAFYQGAWIVHQLIWLGVLLWAVVQKLQSLGVSRGFWFGSACAAVLLVAWLGGFRVLLTVAETAGAPAHQTMLTASFVLQSAVLTLGFMCLILRVYGYRWLAVGVIVIESAAMFYHVLEANTSVAEPRWLPVLWLLGTFVVLCSVYVCAPTPKAVRRPDPELPPTAEHQAFVFSVAALVFALALSGFFSSNSIGTIDKHLKGVSPGGVVPKIAVLAVLDVVESTSIVVVSLGCIVVWFAHSESRYSRRTVLLVHSEASVHTAERTELFLRRAGYHVRCADVASRETSRLIEVFFTVAVLQDGAAPRGDTRESLAKVKDSHFTITTNTIVLPLGAEGGRVDVAADAAEKIAEMVDESDLWYSFV